MSNWFGIKNLRGFFDKGLQIRRKSIVVISCLSGFIDSFPSRLYDHSKCIIILTQVFYSILLLLRFFVMSDMAIDQIVHFYTNE